LEAGDHRLSISEALASWLMVRLAVATRELEKMEWEKQWPMVTKMCANLAKLRRIEKEAKKERQALEAARQQKRKAMVIAEEEMEEWCEAWEEEKVEVARQEAQAAQSKKAAPTAKTAQPGKMGQAEKAVQDVRAAQVARAVQSAKATQTAQVVRAAVTAKSAPGAGVAPANDTEPTLASALAADATGMDALFKAGPRLEKAATERFAHAGFKAASGKTPILTGSIGSFQTAA
jgi:hypothetical protein